MGWKLAIGPIGWCGEMEDFSNYSLVRTFWIMQKEIRDDTLRILGFVWQQLSVFSESCF